MLQAVAACNGRLHARRRPPSPGLEAETVAAWSETLRRRGGGFTKRTAPLTFNILCIWYPSVYLGVLFLGLQNDFRNTCYGGVHQRLLVEINFGPCL